MCGDQGWYAFTPAKYSQGSNEIAYWSMNADDAQRLPDGGWQAFLAGRDANYPASALGRPGIATHAHGFGPRRQDDPRHPLGR